MLMSYSQHQLRINQLKKLCEKESQPFRQQCKDKLNVIKNVMESHGASTVKVDDKHYLRLRGVKSKLALKLEHVEAGLESVKDVRGSQSRIIDSLSEKIDVNRTKEYNVLKIDKMPPRNPLFIKQADPKTIATVLEISKKEKDLKNRICAMQDEIVQLRSKCVPYEPVLQLNLQGGSDVLAVNVGEKNKQYNITWQKRKHPASLALIQKTVSSVFSINNWQQIIDDPVLRSGFAKDIYKEIMENCHTSQHLAFQLKRKKKEE